MDKTRLAEQSKLYQGLTDYRLPKHGFNILQLDGNAFHTYTKGMERPFDTRFVDTMNRTAIAVVESLPTAIFAYVQSDEINIMTYIPEENEKHSGHFNNRIQKIVSLSAAKASVTMSALYPEKQPALFDARFFNVPTRNEAVEHFIWRQRDCVNFFGYFVNISNSFSCWLFHYHSTKFVFC